MSPLAARDSCTKLPRPSAHWQAEPVPTTAQAGIDRRALEGGLRDAQQGGAELRLQAIEAEGLAGVRTVGGQRTVVDLAAGR